VFARTEIAMDILGGRGRPPSRFATPQDGWGARIFFFCVWLIWCVLFLLGFLGISFSFTWISPGC
jgi:hypothetical protein